MIARPFIGVPVKFFAQMFLRLSTFDFPIFRLFSPRTASFPIYAMISRGIMETQPQSTERTARRRPFRCRFGEFGFEKECCLFHTLNNHPPSLYWQTEKFFHAVRFRRMSVRAKPNKNAITANNKNIFEPSVSVLFSSLSLKLSTLVRLQKFSVSDKFVPKESRIGSLCNLPVDNRLCAC